MLLPAGIYVTLSRSATVAETFAHGAAARRAKHVFVLESLPGGEGRDQVRELQAAGVPATLVRDTEALEYVRRADALVVGADAVFSDGTLWHKTGTRALAEAARSAGVPVVVLAGTSKFVLSPAPRRGPPRGFDATPGRMISLVITEDGPRRADRRPGSTGAKAREPRPAA
jgi:translation initiation factor 2B subunit (eIF-2B alpha/beta/delta family)